MSEGCNEAVGVILELPDESWAVQRRDELASTDPEGIAFFGGAIEEDQTVVQAVVAEIGEETTLEELSFSLHCILTIAAGQYGMTKPFTYYVYRAFIKNANFRAKEGRGVEVHHPQQLACRTDTSVPIKLILEHMNGGLPWHSA